jgi:peptide/nickel transport system permease protein
VTSRRRRPLLRFVLRRLLAGLATLLVVSVIIFAATEVLPGDAASAILGRNSTPEAVQEMREELGLDRPAPQRYLEWLGDVLHGDLGNSAVGTAAGSDHSPIWPLISERVKNTAILAVIVILLLIPLSIVLGTAAAVRAGRPTDHAISLLTLALISLPEFVVASVLIIVFASWLDVLPAVSLIPRDAGPLDVPDKLVLPVLTLLGASLASTVRLLRASMVDVLQTEFVQMARLNGFREDRVILRYGLRNALAPTVQVLAQNVQYLVGGIIVVEYVFAYPGIGQKLVESVAVRDIKVVQAVALLIAAIYILLNIIADVLVVYLVPKLRTSA